MARMTLQDVARTAGVSLATVDRVLNRRPGVKPDTARRVLAVVNSLDYRPDRAAARLARGGSHHFTFVLPTGDNPFMDVLRHQVKSAARRFAGDRVDIEVLDVDVFDGEELATALHGLSGRTDGVAAVALDHPSVRQAIDDLEASGIPVVTLVSDVPDAGRTRYVGIDNVAAGRTAASLLGRFVGGRAGKVGLVAGSLSLRDHIERQMGFGQVMGRDFPALEVLPVREGRDQDRRVEELVADLLRQHDDIVGIYNAGAGVSGLVAAVTAAGLAHDVVLIAHDLTVETRRYLLDGKVDAIINQDAGHEVRSAIRILLATRERDDVDPDVERIRVDIFIRENAPPVLNGAK